MKSTSRLVTTTTTATITTTTRNPATSSIISKAQPTTMSLSLPLHCFAVAVTVDVATRYFLCSRTLTQPFALMLSHSRSVAGVRSFECKCRARSLSLLLCFVIYNVVYLYVIIFATFLDVASVWPLSFAYYIFNLFFFCCALCVCVFECVC